MECVMEDIPSYSSIRISRRGGETPRMVGKGAKTKHFLASSTIRTGPRIRGTQALQGQEGDTPRQGIAPIHTPRQAIILGISDIHHT